MASKTSDTREQQTDSGPSGLLTSVAEISSALRRGARFSDFTVAAQEEGYVDARMGEIGVALLAPEVWRQQVALEPHLLRAEAGRTMVGLLGQDADFVGMDALRDRAAVVLVDVPISQERLLVLLRNCVELMEHRGRAAEQGQFAQRYEYELGELITIARAISSERDSDKLLDLILERSRHVTGADAGSVYVLEGEGLDARDKRLHFMLSQNDSMEVDFKRKTLAVDDTSVVGQAVITRQPINIPDLYRLSTDNPLGLRHDRTWDEETGYRTRSMLTVPMVNQRDEVIGCIQLINRKRRPAAKLEHPEDFDREVIPFDKRAEDLCLTLASQAGISLENALLYGDIRRLFESFVQASVTAIESRDPTTAGHSQRVATLTVGLAEVIDRVDTGPYRSCHFDADDLRQIRYAGLLHDFGKVGVRENVLVKAKKLYQGELDLVLLRFDYIRKALQAEASERKLRATMERSGDELKALLAETDAELARRLHEIDEFVKNILQANEPTVLDSRGSDRLVEIAQWRYRDASGEELPYLTEEEVQALRVPRGSLTEEERAQIEHHVVHTINFLKQIPWGRQFKDIPLIAGAHHEKLDGSGYPHRLRADEIPVQAKMMTISDIFDALTAQDRPYKKAVPCERALDIIAADVRGGKCDAELFRLFVEADVFRLVL